MGHGWPHKTSPPPPSFSLRLLLLLRNVISDVFFPQSCPSMGTLASTHHHAWYALRLRFRPRSHALSISMPDVSILSKPSLSFAPSCAALHCAALRPYLHPRRGIKDKKN